MLLLRLSVYICLHVGVMRLVIQRVKEASVHVDGRLISSIGKGVMVLVGLSRDDKQADLDYMCRKLLALRLFEDEEGKKWSKGVKDAQLEILCVSQFTLYGELKGNKLDFRKAMRAEISKEVYTGFVDSLRKAYCPDKIKDGEFGAMMDVSLVNDGPVTYNLETTPERQVSGAANDKE
ncbi:hypothetical protein Ciccas_003102 [Cichlidogyrus casuarinus]|uniref:D-aminoacyl-tRNA deacylase n=1 Tax=Cichlidogyrus casuarinus TaxID=1844966 RepID=A0ABD2QIL0_9PLAT